MRSAHLAGWVQPIARPPPYRYLHEGIDVLAGAAPSCTARDWARGWPGIPHVHLDGTLIPTDRCKAPGPTVGVDLWWSGKHHQHGGMSRW